MARFSNQTVLVTGGTSGIGLATARRVMDEGARVIATGSRQESLDGARDQLNGATLLVNDASDPAAAGALADAIGRAGGVLDAAFLTIIGAMIGALIIAVLQNGVLLLGVSQFWIQAIIGGAILVTGSVVHLMGLPNASIYSAAKGAVRSLVRGLARELAPRGIRVNAIAPGPIGTGFFARTGLDEAAQAEVGEMIKQQVPLGRFGEAHEVAAVAAFLLSGEASYVTGSEYVVDGGMSEL